MVIKKAGAAEIYWQTLSKQTRLDPEVQLVVTAILYVRARNGEAPEVTFRGTTEFSSLACSAVPELKQFVWSIAVPDAEISWRLPRDLVKNPANTLEAFLRLNERSYIKKFSLRPELVDEIAEWLLEETPQAPYWIVGEERAFLSGARSLLSGRAVRFATISEHLALLFTLLKAYGFDAGAAVLKPGAIDLSTLEGPVVTIPEPNTEGDHPPVGKYTIDELNYADALIKNPSRVAAVVSGGMLYRMQGEDEKLKTMYLRSGRLTRVFSFPSATAVEAGVETLGLLLCEKQGFESGVVDLISVPRIRYTRRPWPDDFRRNISLAMRGMDAEGVNVVRTTNLTLLNDRCILSTTSRVETPGDEVIDRLLEERGSRPLSTFVHIIRCHSLGPDCDSADEKDVVYEAIPNDINECGILRRPRKRIRIDPADHTQARRLEKQAIMPGDIIFTQRGRIGSIALVDAVPKKERWVAGQLFVILRLRADSPVESPAYILRCLQCAPIRGRYERMSSNTAVPQVRSEDLDNLLIPLPDRESGVEDAEEAVRKLKRYSKEIEDLRAKAETLIKSVTL